MIGLWRVIRTEIGHLECPPPIAKGCKVDVRLLGWHHRRGRRQRSVYQIFRAIGPWRWGHSKAPAFWPQHVEKKAWHFCFCSCLVTKSCQLGWGMWGRQDSVFSKLNRVRSQGVVNVCSGALTTECARWSRKVSLEQHSALWPVHPFLWIVLLQSHQEVYFRCWPFSREYRKNRGLWPRRPEKYEKLQDQSKKSRVWEPGSTQLQVSASQEIAISGGKM